MKKYLVPDITNREKLVIIGASGFVPQGVVAELPKEFYEEEAEWLIVNDEMDDSGNVRKVVSVDELLKAEILNEREIAKAEYEKLQLRAKKRKFGESIIDMIAVINESKQINGAALDSFMVDPFFSLMREHLKAGNIKTFWQKLNAADVSAIYTAEEKASILNKCEAFLIEIGEVES
jgi:Cft2 family RNA processing exonuclease